MVKTVKKYDYLIVGSGLFGAVFAYEALKRNKKCFVIDKRTHIGGNCYTEEIEGIQVHKYGAHIFRTSKKQVWDYISQFAEFNHFINSPIANYKGEIYNLPFNMNTFNKMWGVITPEEAQRKIASQVIRNDNAQNLEEHVLNLVGAEVYEKLIKGYTEKQWGRECKELPASIMRRIPVRFTYDNNYFNDPYQGIPIGGYTAIIEKMLQGCEIQLASNYCDAPQDYRRIAETVIYTGPIDEYFQYCYGALEYRSLEFRHMILDCENYQGVAVVNYTDRDTPFTRSIEHKHFEFGTQSKTVVTKEYPMPWMKGMEPYYPINDDRNQEIYEKYFELAKKENHVFFGGRLGEYQYYDMQDTILSALELAYTII